MIARLKMTKEGLENQKQKLLQLEKEARELDKKMTKACQNSSGDGPHDNAEFEYLLNLARMKAKEIQDLKFRIANIEIITTNEMANNCINIDDIVDINCIFAPDDEEIMTVQLVGGSAEIIGDQVSINSPLGQAIYGKKIGETVFYEVNDNKIEVNLLRKIKSKVKTK